MTTSTPQTRVRDSRFLLIGAGGLGGPLAYALAAADAGELVLVDDDTVELSNLQRQIQFSTEQVGQPKVEALAAELVPTQTHLDSNLVSMAAGKTLSVVPVGPQ